MEFTRTSQRNFRSTCADPSEIEELMPMRSGEAIPDVIHK